LDGDGSAPIGGEAGGRIEQRVRGGFVPLAVSAGGAPCAVRAWEVSVLEWISGGKREILGLRTVAGRAMLMDGSCWALQAPTGLWEKKT